MRTQSSIRYIEHAHDICLKLLLQQARSANHSQIPEHNKYSHYDSKFRRTPLLVEVRAIQSAVVLRSATFISHGSQGYDMPSIIDDYVDPAPNPDSFI